jgi:hypothetical protein
MSDEWVDAKPPAQLHLENGAVIRHEVGTRVYNYYDMKAGRITQTARYGQPPTMPVHQLDGGTAWWVVVTHDDGTTALLDQSRMCSIEYAREAGWIKPETVA